MWVVALPVLAWLYLPTLVVVPISLTDRPSFSFPPQGWSTRWYRELIDDPRWADALLNSVMIAVLAAATAAVVGVAAAIGVGGLRRQRTRTVMQGLLSAPLLIPEIVVAIAVYLVFLRVGLTGTVLGFVIAHASLGVAVVVTTVYASVKGLDPNLQRAAASLGATPWATARLITLPLLRSAIVAGFLFACVLSFDNVLLSLFLQSPTRTTLPVLMWSSMTRDTSPSIAAASVLIFIVTTVVIVPAWSVAARSRRPTREA